MKHACFWSAVALVAIILCLKIVKASWMRKINEVGQLPIHGRFCGDVFMRMYEIVCHDHISGKRKRSSALIDEKQASSFLHPQAIRSKRSATHAVEECCMEGCQYEEIYEYC